MIGVIGCVGDDDLGRQSLDQRGGLGSLRPFPKQSPEFPERFPLLSGYLVFLRGLASCFTGK